jgi:hypothetical protein
MFVQPSPLEKVLASATTPRSKQSISEHHNSCLVRRRGCFIRLV